MDAITFGKFTKNLKGAPYDTLFHLQIVFTLDSGEKIMLEKNEVINMVVNAPLKPKMEVLEVTAMPSTLKLNDILEKTKASMGSNYFDYNGEMNNCQDFILTLLKSNGIGSEPDFKFVKQETHQLFKGLSGLARLNKTLTDLGGRFNVITEGVGIGEKRYVVQSVIFPIKTFTIKTARKWLKEHKYKFAKVDTTESKLRFRQLAPKTVEKSGFTEYRNKKLGVSGISLILAYKPDMSGGGANPSKVAPESIEIPIGIPARVGELVPQREAVVSIPTPQATPPIVSSISVEDKKTIDKLNKKLKKLEGQRKKIREDLTNSRVMHNLFYEGNEMNPYMVTLENRLANKKQEIEQVKQEIINTYAHNGITFAYPTGTGISGRGAGASVPSRYQILNGKRLELQFKYGSVDRQIKQMMESGIHLNIDKFNKLVDKLTKISQEMADVIAEMEAIDAAEDAEDEAGDTESESSSDEEKETLSGTGIKRKLVKGSPEAKAFMKKLREMRLIVK